MSPTSAVSSVMPSGTSSGVSLGLALAGLACLLPACVTEPYHNQVVTSTTAPMQIRGWMLGTGDPATVRCRPYFTGGAWQDAGTVYSTTTPEQFLHTWTSDGETVYMMAGAVTLPASCWFHWHSQWTTELTFVNEDGYNLRVFDEAGLDCLYDRVLTDQEAPTAATLDCALPGSSIYVHSTAL